MHKCSLRKKVHDLWGCTWERRQEKSPGWGVCIERKAGLSGGSVGKKSACYAGDQVGSQGGEDTLEKGMATHSNILTWRTLWTEEPDELQSMEP